MLTYCERVRCEVIKQLQTCAGLQARDFSSLSISFKAKERGLQDQRACVPLTMSSVP